MATAFVLLPFVARDFFPAVVSGQIRLHLSALPETTIETTKGLLSEVEHQVRRTIPPNELDLIIDSIGLSPEIFKYAFGDGATICSADGEIMMALNEKHHGPADRRQATEIAALASPSDLLQEGQTVQVR